jgi:hypothetical protein
MGTKHIFFPKDNGTGNDTTCKEYNNDRRYSAA